MIDRSRTKLLAAAIVAGTSVLAAALIFRPSTPLPSALSSSVENPASAWFDDQGYDLAAFKDMAADEAVLRLNQAVYSFCDFGNGPSRLDDMYVDCVGQCGGFSYVLRGLLAEIGIETRYANLHNIPMQGNHSAVEALVDGQWIFVDPTFGVAFSDDRTPDGRLLSLSDLYFHHKNRDLEDIVLQAEKSRFDVTDEKLTALYDGVFSHDYMDLRNYQIAERIEYGLEGRLLNLDIPLSLGEGHAELGGDEPMDPAKLEAAWLDATNQTLLDDDLLNDVSFNTSMLHPGRLVTLSLYDLKPGQAYQLELLLTTSSDGQTLQTVNAGKGLLIDRDEHVFAQKGVHPVTVMFTSQRDTGTIMLRSVGTSKLRLFDIEVSEAVSSMARAH